VLKQQQQQKTRSESIHRDELLGYCIKCVYKHLVYLLPLLCIIFGYFYGGRSSEAAVL
jgi:hypothetical protein